MSGLFRDHLMRVYPAILAALAKALHDVVFGL